MDTTAVPKHPLHWVNVQTTAIFDGAKELRALTKDLKVADFALYRQQDDDDQRSSSKRYPIHHVDMRPDGGGAEVLLTAAEQQSSSSRRGASDSLAALPPEMELKFRLLRAKNLPRSNDTTMRVYHHPSTATASKRTSYHLIGELQLAQMSNSTWTIRARQTDEIVVELTYFLDDNDDDTTIVHTSRVTTSVSDLTRTSTTSYPNRWLVFPRDQQHQHPSDTASLTPQIQIRLSEAPFASLQEQETCPRLSPGPNYDTMTTSYRVRKMALWSCAPVLLNVYDVSHSETIETINRYTKATGWGGIFHGAIQVHGKEYSFGGTRQRNSKQTGVFACTPKQCPMHHYRESVYLGDCELNPTQVQAIIQRLRPQWLARSYNLFHKNCCFFSQELAMELGVGDIPTWVYSLAETAAVLEPPAQRMNEYIMMARRQRGQQSKKPTSPSHHRAHEQLLDHAMAARIQRSYRGRPQRGGAGGLK